MGELAISLTGLLTSKRPSEDIQNDLLDLIGFERIELVTLLLEHRKELVETHARDKETLKREIASAASGKKIFKFLFFKDS